MQQMINGHLVEVSTESDGSVDSDILRMAAKIPSDRPLILQMPDGSNKIINPGEKVKVAPEQHFTDAPAHKRGTTSAKKARDEQTSWSLSENTSRRLEEHLKALSRHYVLSIDDDCRFIIVNRVRLPPGYNAEETDVLIELPEDYPLSPPGIGENYVFVPASLRFRGCRLKDIHPDVTPTYSTKGRTPWAWWCYEDIRWDPCRDDLIKFLEMLRSDMTTPLNFPEDRKAKSCNRSQTANRRASVARPSSASAPSQQSCFGAIWAKIRAASEWLLDSGDLFD